MHPTKKKKMTEDPFLFHFHARRRRGGGGGPRSLPHHGTYLHLLVDLPLHRVRRLPAPFIFGRSPFFLHFCHFLRLLGAGDEMAAGALGGPGGARGGGGGDRGAAAALSAARRRRGGPGGSAAAAAAAGGRGARAGRGADAPASQPSSASPPACMGAARRGGRRRRRGRAEAARREPAPRLLWRCWRAAAEGAAAGTGGRPRPGGGRGLPPPNRPPLPAMQPGGGVTRPAWGGARADPRPCSEVGWGSREPADARGSPPSRSCLPARPAGVPAVGVAIVRAGRAAA